MAWHLAENVGTDSKFPTAPGVYVVFIDGALYYVGSSVNLNDRMRSSWCRKDDDSFTRDKVVNVKYSVSKRYGDWLMRELRLIKRLGPRANVQNNSKLGRHTLVDSIRVRSLAVRKKRPNRQFLRNG